MADTNLSSPPSSGCENENELGGVSSGSEAYETPVEDFETKGMEIVNLFVCIKVL